MEIFNPIKVFNRWIIDENTGVKTSFLAMVDFEDVTLIEDYIEQDFSNYEQLTIIGTAYDHAKIYEISFDKAIHYYRSAKRLKSLNSILYNKN